MGDRDSARGVSTRVVVWDEINQHPVNYTTAYLRRLVAERAYIRAALYNHGGSIITHGSSLDLEGQDVYTSQIGNDFHLDLVEAEDIIQTEMGKGHRDALLAWADGVDETIASDLMRVKPSALRKRRQRAVERLTEKMADESGRGSGIVATPVGEGQRDQS